jgi:thiamine-monophosphate kinase
MPSEFDLIARHFAPIAGAAGLGLKDDAALVRTARGYELVVTTDAVAAGVHFFPDDPPASIAQKALGVNLSDLAAKGARPLGFVLSLMAPRAVDDAWLAEFARGLAALASEAACPLIGGDTILTDAPLAISITAFGEVPAGRMALRSGAKPDDLLFVSGTIGDSALGLKLLLAEKAGRMWPLADDHLAHLRDRYLAPRPRFQLADAVQQHAHASMDISDGFVGDLTKMLTLAGVGAEIRLSDVPHSVAARAAIRMDRELRETALTGGDDYEIVAAVPIERAESFAASCLAARVPVVRAGHVTGSRAIRFLNDDGSEQQFTRGSYIHGA